LHVGTLLAIVIYFAGDIVALVRAVPQALRGLPKRSPKRGQSPFDRDKGAVPFSGEEAVPFSAEARELWLLAIGTIPVVIVGVLFNHWIEERLRTPHVAATALALG